MIVPKRRLVFYFIVVLSMVWIYLAAYYMFTGNIESSEENIALISDIKSPLQNDVRLVSANYDRTPDRNPDKPGEWGAGVTLNFLEKRQESEGYKEHAFNRVVSDKISIQRNLLDNRNSKWVTKHNFLVEAKGFTKGVRRCVFHAQKLRSRLCVVRLVMCPLPD